MFVLFSKQEGVCGGALDLVFSGQHHIKSAHKRTKAPMHTTYLKKLSWGISVG
ncbi:hypothetical protein HHE02_11520 [Helicobacter heilmannii]|uniref:Uncharacterized protein n=1 Tax=Helicobacter heilmannii TaxID=35817 RepID=A0A0K2XG79_HELHE|nr:hypothetical protein BN341_12350 [Helicobacter heilmannii ASB1.4]CRF46306.1 hypothetical protein HHE014_13040 [Helicobacter heilmannii]CRF47854.1 hypothetical protein HHE02_11520 [Helicobacter heilmannii]CRF48467.1 hypothetical protein HHE03_00140 [Helicobacter heilmannii]CRF50701.1 hypothetical protein HHE06_05440 [Helicobacter heilmannii]